MVPANTRGLISRIDRQARRAVQWFQRRRRRAHEAHGLVLMYHRVASVPVDPWRLTVSPGHFDDQVRMLGQHADIVPLVRLRESLRNGRSSRPVIAISFDDGYADNLEVAKPILERYRAPATVFVTTGFIGRREAFWWDRLADAILLPDVLPRVLRLGENGSGFVWKDADLGERGAAGGKARRHLHDRLWDWLSGESEAGRSMHLDGLERWAGRARPGDESARPMTAGEIRKLVADGVIDVGAHTVSHPRLTRLSRTDKQAEIRESRRELGRVLGIEPACFAFPNGDYDTESVELVRAAGFAVACTSRPDLVWATGDAHAMPRVSVPDCTGESLWRYLRWRWLN